ncbi:protein NRT1/ PTR FAMILY 2.13-like isoform X2 [Citrus sinensis]|uniref:protein NRT1/ PTR FAMILY 2.13-like isoform X2 n=1 Tax=Citrus sinensis TaxID=2711 RepID=UPI0003D6EFBC|nr:protein NRT1/ PTR FAMILY 2.13-like isoform X2 [Citrus sinensis]
MVGDQKQKDQKKPGGWKAMPYILGNETFERLATIGLLANFMVYLLKEYHMNQTSAANILNIWGGVTNFAPLLGAFISDTYTGRFKTITFASIAAILGMLTVTLTAWLPQLHPPKCDVAKPPFGQCKSANSMQLGVLVMGLGMLSIGTGGIRPCSIPFGVDQFDATTDEGVKGINSFFNWYYTTFTVVILITQTVLVYIQDSVSWVIGFGIPTVLMIGAIILFLVGKKLYVLVEPEGSIFSGIGQVLVAAYKKRRLTLPQGQMDHHGIFYDPPPKLFVLSKLPLTHQFRFLNKAAMIVDNNELKPDGTPVNQWRLCSIQQVEEVKCLIKIIPIWAAGIISLTSISQQGTFTVSQAMKMNRHLGPKFQIPPGTVGVISMITIGLWLPFYDTVLVPALRKITKHEGGITLLQRIGIGMIFSILSMIVAGLVERGRRASAHLHPMSQVSVFWLAPQLILMGFCEAFNIIGQIEFFNKQFPDHMRSIANSLLFCSFGFASYLSSLLITIVHGVTARHGHPDWLTNDIDAGRLDYFYFLIAGLGGLNIVYFLYCARRYRYKSGIQSLEDQKPYLDLELVDPTKQ